MKKVLGILIIVIALGFAVYFIFLNKNTNPLPVSETETPPTSEVQATAKDLNPDLPRSVTFYISTPSGSVKVNNFYLQDPKVVEADNISIASGSGYQILYSMDGAVFWITFSGQPSQEARGSAESNLLSVLGVSRADACKLSVWELQENSASRAPLSFCGRAL